MKRWLDKISKITDSNSKQGQRSFSQSGEDLIMKFVTNALKIQKPTYLDIGANDPVHLNNTYCFYIDGSRGVNVEADPDLFAVLKQRRSRDINLNIGIAPSEGTMDFYRLNAKTLNTFSKEEAESYVRDHNYKIESVIQVSTDTINNTIEKYFDGSAPDILNLDVEGLDSQIIESLDFQKYSPVVICVETISFSETGDGEKDRELISFISDKGYLLYADTYINSIFVKEASWRKV